MTYIMSCVWLDYMVKYFQCKNCVGSSPKTKKCVASFLVPVYSVTLDPIRFWVQRRFYILFPDRLTRHLFQPHFPGEAPNRTYAPGHLLFKLNRTSQSRHIFQPLLAE